MGKDKKEKIPEYEIWYNEFIVDNQEEIWEIANVANMMLDQKLKLTIDPKLTIAMYGVTLEAYVEYLKTKQKEDYNEFCINIMNTLEIGYNSSFHDEEEKTGNFMVFMHHIPSYKTLETDTSLDKSDEICALWANSNLSVDSQQIIRDMNAFAKDYLRQHLNIAVENSAIILMIFLIVHDTIIKTISLKRQEENAPTYMITIAGLIEISCTENTDGDCEDIIQFKVTPSVKQIGKDDGRATGV